MKDLSLPVEFNLENMNFFIDWQRNDVYQVIRGEGECAVLIWPSLPPQISST